MRNKRKRNGDSARLINAGPNRTFAHSENGRHKGQLFIIAAVFIVAGLVLIFGVLSSPPVVEEKKFQDVRQLDKNARNVLNEYRYAAGVATLNSPANASLRTYMANLSDYYRRELDSGILYAAVVANGSTQRFSVGVGNYLSDRVNMSVNATDASPAGVQFVLSDKTDTVIDFAATANATINVTLDYAAGTRRVVERFAVNVSARNFMLLFSDITLRDGTLELRIKDTYNRTW
jgi:hypothetical protein